MKVKIDRLTIQKVRVLPKNTRIFDIMTRGFFIRSNGPDSVPSYGVIYGPATKRRQKTIGLATSKYTPQKAREDAQDILSGARHGKDPAEEEAARKAERTFSEWASEYIERAKGRKRTWKRDVQYLGLGQELFGAKRLSEVSARDCDVFFNRTRQQRGDVSANRALASLRACLQDAWRLGYIEGNPAQRVKLLREPPPRTRVFDEGETERLLAAIAKLQDPYQKAGMILMFSTGCRLSEALRLRWEDVDLELETMRLPSPKSGRPQAIPLPAPVTAFLKKLPRLGAYVVAGRYLNKPRVDLKRAWLAVCMEARVKGNIHDVRRTVGTRLAQRFGVEVAQHILRHSTPGVTVPFPEILIT